MLGKNIIKVIIFTEDFRLLLTCSLKHFCIKLIVSGCALLVSFENSGCGGIRSSACSQTMAFSSSPKNSVKILFF